MLLICVCAGVWGSPASGQMNQSPARPSQLEKAQSLLTAGKPDAAIELLRAIPEGEANQSLVTHLLGLAYYQKSDYGRAIEHLSRSVKQAPEKSRQYHQAVQMLGMSHYLLGDVKEAIPYLEEVKEWSPDNIEAAYALGNSYIRTQNADGARRAFSRMFAVPTDSASAYLLNAQMMIRLQVEVLAEKELQTALELDPKLPQANFLLGELAIYRAQIDLGIELLKKEIAVNPAFAMAYYRLGEAYTRQLKWDEAISPLQKSIWLNPFFSGPYVVLGRVYLKKREPANAEAMLRRAVKMDPNNYSAHYQLAQVLQETNRLEEAKREFEIADKLRTDSDK